MLILGIETASSQVGCAIGGPDGVVASCHAVRPRMHAELLAPQIDMVCRQAGVALSELGAVAVDVGPGLFTGLRAGIATGVTMAHALGIPMVGVASLDLLAFVVRHSNRRIVAVLDARRDEVFHAAYRRVPGGVQRLDGYSVSRPDDLAADLQASGEECLLVGDGAGRYAEVFREIGHVEVVIPGVAHPDARALVELAHARAMREEFVAPTAIEPLYLREPDAAINWTTRSGRVGGVR